MSCLLEVRKEKTYNQKQAWEEQCCYFQLLPVSAHWFLILQLETGSFTEGCPLKGKLDIRFDCKDNFQLLCCGNSSNLTSHLLIGTSAFSAWSH